MGREMGTNLYRGCRRLNLTHQNSLYQCLHDEATAVLGDYQT